MIEAQERLEKSSKKVTRTHPRCWFSRGLLIYRTEENYLRDKGRAQEDLFENDFPRSNSLSDCEVGKGYPYKLHKHLNVLKTFKRATLEDCKKSCRRMGNSFFSPNYCSYFVHGVSFSTLAREYCQRANFIIWNLFTKNLSWKLDYC